MFDVRPRTAQGDLDLERIKKIQQVLDLAAKAKVYLKIAKDYEASRLVDLREETPQKRNFKKTPKKRKNLGQIFSDEQVLKSLLGGRVGVWEDKSSYPSREEILATLQEIEELNQSLQAGGLEADELAENLVQELKTEIAQIDAEDFFDLDELLKPQASDVLVSAFVPGPEAVVSPKAEILTAELPEPGSAALTEVVIEPRVLIESEFVIPALSRNPESVSINKDLDSRRSLPRHCGAGMTQN